MSKPRIGLVAMSATSSTRGTPLAAVNRAYVDAVVAEGGLPILLPIQDPTDAADAVAAVDGMVLCGGGDVSPAEYGEAGGPGIDGVDKERDEQILNVSAGGTLVRDVPAATGMAHRDTERSHQVVHDVWIEPDSLLAELCANVCIGVNTLHHQAVERLGQGLRPVAWAEDATIEAIESTTEWPAIGVQWHPELLVGHGSDDLARPHRALFSWIVSAAQARRMHFVLGEAVEQAPARLSTMATIGSRQAS
jgi:putative glutamine amidotransferase